MVDPVNCTDFSRDQYSLEEFAVFCVCVANKTAKVIAPAVHRLLTSLPGETPFEKLRKPRLTRLVSLIVKHGMGCQTMKGRGLYELSRKGLDLRTCSVQDLESVYGIGQKTSRYFILHTRQDQNCIPLDTHMLKFLRDKGIECPTSAPSSAKRYAELEAHALKFAKERAMTPAEFDLTVWRHYSGNTPGESHEGNQDQPRPQVESGHSTTSCTTSTPSRTPRRAMSTLVKLAG